MLFIISIIFARHWGAAFMGVFALVKVSASIFYIFSECGISSAIIYYGSKETWPDKILWGNVIAVALLLGCVSWIIYGAAILLFRSRLFPDFTGTQVLLTGCIVGLMLFTGMLSAGIRARQKVVLSYLTILLPEVLVILPLLALLLTEDSYVQSQFISIFNLTVVPQLLGSIVCYALVAQLLGFKPVPAARIDVLKSFLQYGKRAYVGSTASYLSFRLDVFLLGLLSTQSQVGIYFAASRLAEVMRMTSTSVSYVLKPRIVRKSLDGARECVLAYRNYLLLFGIVGGTGVFVAAGPLVRHLYGEAFSEAAILLRVLIPGMSVSIINGLYGAFFDGRGKPEYTSYAVLAGFIVTCIGCAVLIYPFKTIGAAATSTASYLTVTVVLLHLFGSDRVRPH
jgi:O-antigen/teichoic acid export membrane protein